MAGPDDKQVVCDLLAWLFNVSTSVVIVFVNKVLMGNKGYMFSFAVTLCAFHFLSCGMSLSLMKMVGIIKGVAKPVPMTDRIIFSTAANLSIATLNLSLMINSVGFYQIAKLLIIPFTAVVEALWLREHMSAQQMLCTATVLVGVGIVTVSDVTSSTLGIIIATVSVASSAMQQILCRYYQKKHDLASNDLLGATAPMQGWSLLVIGPSIDRFMVGRWPSEYELNVPAIVCLATSCGVAVLVNISQFMCLGRFSAVTFQVTGHAKTVLVLLGSWVYLQEPMGAKECTGMGLAVLGMIGYGYVTSQQAKPVTVGPGSTAAKDRVSLLSQAR